MECDGGGLHHRRIHPIMVLRCAERKMHAERRWHGESHWHVNSRRPVIAAVIRLSLLNGGDHRRDHFDQSNTGYRHMKRRGAFNNPEPLICIAIIGVAIGLLLPWIKQEGAVGWTAFCILLVILAPFVFYLLICVYGIMSDHLSLRFRQGRTKPQVDKLSQNRE
jgi:hypothetical protein